MLEELEKTKEQLKRMEEAMNKEKFFQIEKTDIHKIENQKEIENIIEILLEIRTLSNYLGRPFAFIQCQSIEKRIEAEKHLNYLKQKALQKEELVFLFGFLFLFLAGNFYYFFHDFRIFLA